MSERRYVVEIARAVAGDRIESASDYVAERLGMDRQRIRTLLAGRTGPVTRPVLPAKADSIAEVFTAAGVTVMIVEAVDDTVAADDLRDDAPTHDAAPPAGSSHEDVLGSVPTSGTEPFMDLDLGATDFEEPDLQSAAFDSDEYEAEGFGPTEDPSHDWNIDSAWESDDDDDEPWHRQATVERDGGPSADAATSDVDPEAPAASSPAGDAAEAVTAVGEEPVAAEPTARSEPADLDDPQLPSTRWVPSPFDDPTDQLDVHDVHRDDLTITWLPADERRGSGIDLGTIGDGDASREPSRPWVTPGRSQFGDLSSPEERTPLRSFLLWALVVSVVVLIGLQLLFAVRERGAGVATFETGLQAYRDGDFVTARRRWEDVARSGSADAQFMLGHLVQNGLGQPWSNAAAAEWYRQAADQDLPEAQTALADLYLRGVGVEPNLETGAQLLERAAASGHPPAVYQYAELLLHGRGVAQDFDAALELFTRAAAAGSVEAADFVALAEHVRLAAEGIAAQQ